MVLPSTDCRIANESSNKKLKLDATDLARKRNLGFRHSWATTTTHLLTMTAPTESSLPVEQEGPNVTHTRRWIWRALLVVPYAAGVVWTCLHPVVSVVTGELKCRGWYIDENSLDPSYFRFDAPYHPPRAGLMTDTTSLCNAIQLFGPAGSENATPRDNIVCHTLPTESSPSMDTNDPIGVEVLSVTPLSNGVVPSESVVLVIPPTTKWIVDDFHNSILQLIRRLSSPKDCPWLAKTIVFVSSNDLSMSVETITDTFLDAYVGRVGPANNGTILRQEQTLPYELSSKTIRALFVLDVHADSTGSPETIVHVLPQGRNGILPNMDLVFLTTTVLQRGSFADARRQAVHFAVHPYKDLNVQWNTLVHQLLGDDPQHAYLRNWASNLGSLALFGYSLAMGSTAPHVSALDRGIDALTIHIRFLGRHPRIVSSQVVEVTQKMEYTIRAVSNLHERLHHSLTQYLMPTAFTFVSHSEYLIPNILLLLPVLVMAVRTMLFTKGFVFHVATLQHLPVIAMMCCFIQATTVLTFDLEHSTHILTGVLTVLYGTTIAWVHSKPKTNGSDQTKQMATKERQRTSLHFLTCLLFLYLHIPLILQHVSLAFPSTVLFVPLLVVSSFALSTGSNRVIRLLFLGHLIALWPPVVLVPRLFSTYTHYVNYVYLPLHLLLVCQTI